MMRRFTVTYERRFSGTGNVQMRTIEGCQFSDGRVSYVEPNSPRSGGPMTIDQLMDYLTDDGFFPVLEWIDE